MRSSAVRYFLAVIVLGIVASCAPPNDSGFAPIITPLDPNNGLMTITTNTTLSADHAGQIKIDADNITLDCANHKVSFTLDNTIGCGLSHTFRCGIHVENRSGVTIKNCEVTGAFDYGFWIAGSTTPALVENVTARSNVVGIRIESSDKVTVRNSMATTCTDDGIDIRRSSNITIIGVSSINNANGGIDTNDASYVKIQDANVEGNGGIGIEFDGGPHASVVKSTIRKNGGHGLSFDPSEFNPLNFQCSDFLVEDNLVENNTLEGIKLHACHNGKFKNNTSQANVGCNAHQTSTSDGISWKSNDLENWCGTVPKNH